MTGYRSFDLYNERHVPARTRGAFILSVYRTGIARRSRVKEADAGKYSTLLSKTAEPVRLDYEPPNPMFPAILILALLTLLVAADAATSGECESCD